MINFLIVCELCKNELTNRDAVWDAQSGGYREHVLHGKGHFRGVSPTEKHCQA